VSVVAMRGVIIVLLGAFAALGVAVTVRAIMIAEADRRRRDGRRPRRSLAERGRDYVGPVDPRKAHLTPPLRVLVEFCFALCGFPGLGWLMSARMLPGIILMSVVPSFVWGLIPLWLVVSGTIVRNVYSLVIYLPAVALLSAGTLAIVELRGARAAVAGRHA